MFRGGKIADPDAIVWKREKRIANGDWRRENKFGASWHHALTCVLRGVENQ